MADRFAGRAAVIGSSHRPPVVEGKYVERGEDRLASAVERSVFDPIN